MKVSIMIETMYGLTWPIWKRMVDELEAMGFAAVYRSDHFPFGSPPITDALEVITSLTYLADHTRRIDFGILVAPLSFRDPVMLARQAMTLNDLSGGRMILGVGTGWHEQEHSTFGYELGDLNTRFERFTEGLEVITCLIREEQPQNFHGRFYKLQNARLLPRPQQPTRILLGGNGLKRTLPLVARYADIWNCYDTSIEIFRDLSRHLDQMLLDRNRQPSDVTRSVLNPVFLWRTPQELDDLLANFRKIPTMASMTAEELASMNARMHGSMGAPEQAVEWMKTYAGAGVDEFVIQWFNPHDWTGLKILAKEVLPHFA